jgi:hypothetical protein
LFPGGSKVTIQGQGTDELTLTSAGRSDSANDVGVQVSVDSQVSDQFNITILAPHSLVQHSLTDAVSGTFGYSTTIVYRLRDQFTTNLPSNRAMDVNEDFTTGVITDFAGMNWRQANEVGGHYFSSTFIQEFMEGEQSSRTPTPQAPQNPLGSTAVCHWNQSINIGTQTVGQGRTVQTNVQQKYRDHARHTNITTPASP